MGGVDAAEARGALLRRLGVLITEHAAEPLATSSCGRTASSSARSATRRKALADNCNFFAGVAEMPLGDTLASSMPNMAGFTVREPIGVVAAITPWNSPLTLLIVEAGARAGRGLHRGRQAVGGHPGVHARPRAAHRGSGFPSGVVNVVTGAGEVGAALVAHPGVDEDLLHRLDRGRQADRRDRGDPDGPRLAGAGRQVPEHRLSRTPICPTRSTA